MKSNSVKIYLLIFAINIANADSVKFGLGSCLDQDYPLPIWNSIEKEELDYFIFLGDNVYGDSRFGDLRKMKRAYDKQKTLLPSFLNDLEVLSLIHI